jgi:hypothetical protein
MFLIVEKASFGSGNLFNRIHITYFEPLEMNYGYTVVATVQTPHTYLAKCQRRFDEI